MILDKLANATRKRVEASKEKVSYEEMKKKALAMESHTGFPFEAALQKDGINFICEVKKASPSKGLIAPDFPYLEIARDYEKAGAAAISVLTETDYFLGSSEYLREIAENVRIPVLRKDFTIDSYMIYEAKVLGAAAVLLIVSLLDEETIREYITICDRLGLSALVEVHDENEMATALSAGARIIGVNNRNLKDFMVDINNSARLRALVPADRIFVAESGIKTAQDIESLRRSKVNAVLIGETLMRSSDKKAMLDELRGISQEQLAAQSKNTAVKVKICGLTHPEDIACVNECRPDYVGFVFYPKSSRFVTEEKAKSLRSLLRREIQTVGVFVNEKPEKIISLCERGVIDLIQLHGDEDEAYIRFLKERVPHPVIRGVRVRGREDVLRAQQLPCDYLLLDTYQKDCYGGSGQTFALEWIPKLSKPFFLAGGLCAENVKEKIEAIHPYAVDISSGVEGANGKKDPEKIVGFIKNVREAEK